MRPPPIISPDGRWRWDGVKWVPRVAPVNHGAHLFLCVITCGLWLPFYFLAWAANSRANNASPDLWYGDRF